MNFEPNDDAAGAARNPFHVPPLTTARLLVRELRPSDLDAVHAIFTDIGWNPPDLASETARMARSAWLDWTICGYRQLEKLYQPPASSLLTAGGPSCDEPGAGIRHALWRA